MRARAGWVLALLSVAAAGCRSEAPAVAPAQAYDLYVSLPAADGVVRVDPVLGKPLAATTTVGSLPHNFLAHPDGRRLYLVLVGSQAVAEFDLTTGAVTRTFLTEAVPQQRDDGSVIQEHLDRHAETHSTCYDCHNPAPDGARPVVVGSRPFAMAFNADATALYVTNMRTRSLTTIDLASGAVTDRTALAPSGDAFEPTGLARLDDNLYVALRPGIPSSKPGAMRRLDAATHTVTADAANGPNTSVVIADEKKRRLYVNNFETNTVTAYSESGAVLAAYSVGPGPLGLRLLAGGTRLLSANYYDDSISLVDVASGNTQTMPLTVSEKYFPNPTHSALAPNGEKLYLVSSGTRGHLLTFDLAATRFTAAVEVGGLPFDVVVVPKLAPQ